MEGKIRLAVFGQKRLSREGGIEIVVKELCTRMAQNGCEVTCYNRAGHHVSGAEYDKTIEYDGIRQKVVPTIEKKGLAAVSSSFFAALCSAFGRYDVVHTNSFFCAKCGCLYDIACGRNCANNSGLLCTKICEIVRNFQDNPKYGFR